VSGVSYEKEDADTRLVIRAGIVLALVTLVASALVLVLFRWLAEREARSDAPPPPMVRTEPGRLPPAPRLQTLPAQDLAAVRAEEDRTLGTYGWVDERAGTVRIPIDEAMRLLAQRGEAPLPRVSPSAAPSPASAATPSAAAPPPAATPGHRP
jgi:hypothetical protein